MKQSELKRLEALERKMDNVFKWVEYHQTKGKHTGEYARGDEPLDLTKILEVGDEVCCDEWGDVVVSCIVEGDYPVITRHKKYGRITFSKNGYHNIKFSDTSVKLKPKNGKTWAQFIAEKEEKKQQIPTLEKAIEDIKKGLEKFDAPEVEVHMTLKKLKSGGYAPSKIYVTDH